MFTVEDAALLGAVTMCAPPLRPRGEQEAFWAHLLGGILLIVASDHSLAPDANMRRLLRDLEGSAGCQSMLAGNMAPHFKVPGKGRIAEGADADLALVDLSHEARLTVDDLLYRHKVSPYVGQILRGRAIRTLVRGRAVAREGRIVAAGGGQLVRPSLDPPSVAPPAGSASADEGSLKTQLTARFVIGYAGRDHVIYPGGEVVYDGDTIVFVGHGYPGPVDITHDYGDAIGSPGSIDLNALADIDHAILDTWLPPDRQLGQQGSEEYFRKERRETFTFADELFKRRYALVQPNLDGITTATPIAAETYRAWAETYEEFAATVEIAAELGLRMYLGPSYRGGVNVTRDDGVPDVLWDELLGKEGLEAAVRFVRGFDGAQLYNTNGTNVRTVIINGRSVMEDRRIPGVDEAAMRERAQRLFVDYKRAFIARDDLHRAPDDLFPPSFEVIAPPR